MRSRLLLLTLLLNFTMLSSLTWAQSGTLILGNRVLHGHQNTCTDTNGDANANTYVCGLVRTLPSYRTGTQFTFIAGSTNTGAATLNIDSRGAKSIVKTMGGITTALVANDIRTGQIVDVIYDGTNMQMLSPPGTTTQTIASGTIALATSAIASGVCATAQTSTATGVASTDAIISSFNADITSVTGYTAATTGTLRVDVYPTTNTVNVRVCNATAASVTPGAVTLNYRVVR